MEIKRCQNCKQSFTIEPDDTSYNVLDLIITLKVQGI